MRFGSFCFHDNCGPVYLRRVEYDKYTIKVYSGTNYVSCLGLVI